jgi:hypothetical protein
MKKLMSANLRFRASGTRNMRAHPAFFFVIILMAFAATFFDGRTSAGENAAGLKIVKDASTVSIFEGDRPVLRYRYAGGPMKPYADELISPAGVQILRDSPSDHKHHHGLMFALDVDGINFWEESEANSGQEKAQPVQLLPETTNDAGRAGFEQTLTWVDPVANKPMLCERRVVSAYPSAGLGATLIDWRCRLTPPPGKDSVAVGGNHYFGLGMRFLHSMDTGGRFFCADKAIGPILHEDKRLTPTKWCAFAAKADGKPVTVAIFDSPDNVRFPGMKFTMLQPFSYLAATLSNVHELAIPPIALKAGRPLELRYGVALWDGDPDAATVEKVYQEWLSRH